MHACVRAGAPVCFSLVQYEKVKTAKSLLRFNSAHGCSPRLFCFVLFCLLLFLKGTMGVQGCEMSL